MTTTPRPTPAWVLQFAPINPLDTDQRKIRGRHCAAAFTVLTLLALGGCDSGNYDNSTTADAAAIQACKVAFETEGATTDFGDITPIRTASAAVPGDTKTRNSGFHIMRAAFSTSSSSIDSTAANPVPLSTCKVDAARNVVIGGLDGCGPKVIIDQDFTGPNALGKITIAVGGGLAVPHEFKTLELHTSGIKVGGTLSVGTSLCPIGLMNPDSKVKIVFTGKSTDSSADPGTANGAGMDKGIEVEAGGILRMYGHKGVATTAAARSDGVSWTTLSQPGGPDKYLKTGTPGIGAPVAEASGGHTLHLSHNVTIGTGAWRRGDWIVVATSSFSPFESEFVQIATIDANNSGGTDLTLTQALRHYHFGSADPGAPSAANFGAGKDVNFGVDERSEVGLISRSITLTSETPKMAANPNDRELHWGGEIRVLQGFAEASIQGVELEKFGKERLGSYPIHLHMVGDASKSKTLFNSNSIHHSYNKCIAVHSSSSLTFENNVCARVVGHLFYEEIGNEYDIRFLNNLGLGAMSNSFGIELDPSKLPAAMKGNPTKNWWEGDNLALANDYDGLNIRNMDDQTNPTHGACFTPGIPGQLNFAKALNNGEKCAQEQIYVESASGLWITNPGTILEGNSIGGCQGMGTGYWYVTPALNTKMLPDADNLKYQLIGSFKNNRVHACYDGLFAENEKSVPQVGQLQPKVGGVNSGRNLITHFNGLTATRIRNRGAWIRPTWNVFENGRFATNRDSATLVSSGGPDGNAPGVWALLQDSVLVGVSNNNVDRWGPCPNTTDGTNLGCVDYNPKANDILDKTYQTPAWNSAGYMIYDGPVRIFHNHFVNFLLDPTTLLTADDAAIMNNFTAFPNGSKSKRYEGDAALGWFQTNQSAYPTATTVRQLSFENVDLRHQIYTENVNQSGFDDGDKNTAIIDLDGSLTGYKVVGPNGEEVAGHYPVSLNNLEFNHASNAADECLSTGNQDEDLEGRPTSIISPAHMATLEFDTLNGYPAIAGTWWQDMIFSKNSKAAGEIDYSTMRLHSRNGQGVWEPKVSSGFGYVVQSAPETKPGISVVANGMANIVNVGLTDAVKPHMDKEPFYVRLGIRYVNAAGGAPDANTPITITRGFKSWGGNAVNYSDPVLKESFNFLDGVTTYGGGNCKNINGGNLGNFLGCPAKSSIPKPAKGCPAGSEDDPLGQPFCIFKPITLTKVVGGLVDLTDATTGKPTGDNYYYDAANGILFFYVQQNFENARGPAPLGSCVDGSDPTCPDQNELDTYYPCPAQGCVNYQVVLGNAYTPGPNTSPMPAAQIGAAYNLAPQNQNQLAYIDNNVVVKPNGLLSNKGFYHWAADRDESTFCPTTTPKPVKSVARAKTMAFTRTALASAKYWLGSAVSVAELSAPEWLKFTGNSHAPTLVADARKFNTRLGPVCSASQYQ